LIWCTVLNPALDIIYHVNEFHNGTTYLDCALTQIPAGKGLNVARVIQTLGEEVSVTGLLSELDGKRVTNFLDAQSIPYAFFPVPGVMRINTTILDESSGSSTHISSCSPMLSSRIQHEYITFAAERMQHGDLWCVTGSLPGGFDDTTYAKLIETGKTSDLTILLDTRGAALKHGIRARPMIVKPNLSELEEFFEEQIQGVHHIALKGKRLLDMGIDFVFISLGADGMIALHKNDCLLCNAPQVNVRDTVGCGDALVAGIMVAYKRQFSFTETCRMAVACGSAKSMQQGPGILSRETVWQLMEDIRITSI
jgi:tagatose 6-phosphate kinase